MVQCFIINMTTTTVNVHFSYAVIYSPEKDCGRHIMKALILDNQSRRWFEKEVVSLWTLTLLWQVMFLCLPLHVFAPSLQPLGFIVKELHKPAPVPAKRGHTACFSDFQAGFDQPGLRLWAGGPTGRPVVLPVTEQSLCAHCTDGSILCRSAGLRVATEATTKLKALVLHGGKPL